MHWFGETRDNYCPQWFDAMEQAFPKVKHVMIHVNPAEESPEGHGDA
jgi:hypothetical protein